MKTSQLLAILTSLFLYGCSHIPHPTDSWTYNWLDEPFNIIFERATVCLIVRYTVEDIGATTGNVFFFEKKGINKDEPLLGYGSIGISDGGKFRVSTIDERSFDILPEHMKLKKKFEYESPDLNYRFDAKFTIKYSKTGTTSSDNVLCSWRWVELNHTTWTLLAKEMGWDFLVFRDDKPAEPEPEPFEDVSIDDLFGKSERHSSSDDLDDIF